MNYTRALLVATSVIGFAANGYAVDASSQAESKMEQKKNGGYEATRSTERTAADGTVHATEREVDVDVDASGNIDRSVKTVNTTDPKGLMNKKKDVAETEIEEKDNGGYKQTTTRSFTDKDGTNIRYETITDVSIDNAGNVTTTATTEKTVDPKGLLNQQKTTNKTKTVNGRVVESKTEVDN